MLEVDRFCKRQLTTKRFRVAFNADGKVSLRRSDLNGNGVAAGGGGLVGYAGGKPPIAVACSQTTCQRPRGFS